MLAHVLRNSVVAMAFSLMFASGCQSGAPNPKEPDQAAAAEPQAHAHVHKGGHHRFENAERWAKVFDAPERDAWQKPDQVVDWLRLHENDRVADIGAGTGYFSVRFAQKVPNGKVFANDIEQSMVEYLDARAKKLGLTNHLAVLGGADKPGLPEQVDVAFLCDVYHHISDRKAYFTALTAQLQREGRLIIVDFKPDAPEGTPGPPKAMRVSVQQITGELAPLGLKLRRRELALLPYQYVLEFTR